MLLRVGADQRNRFIAQMASRPHWAELRIDKVGTASRMRGLADIDQGRQFIFLGVHHRDLVGGIGGHQEITAGAIETAIVQELGAVDGRRLEISEVFVIDHHDLAGFLGVDHEFGTEMRGDDRGHARFRVILAVHGHAAGGDDFQRLEGVAFHDHVLRRPVRTGDGVLVLIALVLGGFHRAGFQTNLDFRDRLRFFHPQVDQVDAGVPTDHVQVAAGGGQAGDVHRVAGRNNADDLLGIAVDQRNLTRIAQGHGDYILNVIVIHLLGGALLRRNHQLPGRFHFLEAKLWRRGRLLLNVTRHQIDFFVSQLPGGSPIGHPSG